MAKATNIQQQTSTSTVLQISEALRLAVEGAADVLASIERLDAGAKAGSEAKKQQQAQLVSLLSPLSLEETRTAIASIMKRAAEALATASDDRRKAGMQSRARALSRAVNKTLSGNGTWKVVAHKAVKGLYVLEFEERTTDVERAKADFDSALNALLSLGMTAHIKEAVESAMATAEADAALLGSLI